MNDLFVDLDSTLTAITGSALSYTIFLNGTNAGPDGLDGIAARISIVGKGYIVIDVSGTYTP